MKIVGDTSQASLTQKEGILFGSNDILKITIEESFKLANGSPGSTLTSASYPVHISNTIWSKFTGILREYCLP